MEPWIRWKLNENTRTWELWQGFSVTNWIPEAHLVTLTLPWDQAQKQTMKAFGVPLPEEARPSTST